MIFTYYTNSHYNTDSHSLYKMINFMTLIYENQQNMFTEVKVIFNILPPGKLIV